VALAPGEVRWLCACGGSADFPFVPAGGDCGGCAARGLRPRRLANDGGEAEALFDVCCCAAAP